MRSVLLVALVTLTACGSKPQFEAPPPPSATLQVIPGTGPAAHHRGRAQTIWIGNHVLTAAHVLVPDFDDPALATAFFLNGDRVRILDSVSGDLDALARVYSSEGGPQNPSDWLEDWVVAEVSRSAPAPATLHLCDRPIRPGDRLYAVGYPPQEDRPQLQAIPLTVLEFHIEEEWDDAARAALEDLVPVRVPRDHHLRGWSGSFVGRYDARDKKWCYIGLLIFGVEEPDGGSVVLRPPPEALELLLRGD